MSNRKINVSGSTRAAIIISIGVTLVTAFTAYKAKDNSDKYGLMSLSLLSGGIATGLTTASFIMRQRVDRETESLNKSVLAEVDQLTKAKTKAEDLLITEKNLNVAHVSDIRRLENLLHEKEQLIAKLQLAFSKLQQETIIKQKELDEKLSKEFTYQVDLQEMLRHEFVEDLRYKINEVFESVTNSVISKIKRLQDNETVLVKLENFHGKLAKRKQDCLTALSSLNEIDFNHTDISDGYFGIWDELAMLKVQYRNILNTSNLLNLQEQARELEERRNPANFVPRSKVLQALDINSEHLESQRLRFEGLVNDQFSSFNELKNNVGDLLDQIDAKNLEISDLKEVINEYRKPLKWALANSRELQIGNLIIDFFWQSGNGLYFDRSHHEFDGYDLKLYFQIDRNPRYVNEQELNSKSEELQQYCRTLHPITFSYSGSKSLMVAKAVIRDKPKNQVNEDAIRRICLPHESFAAKVSVYDRWRITGGSQAGKSPTAQFIIDAILKYKNGVQSKVRLFNPQHGSIKDNWQYVAEGTDAAATLKGFETLKNEIAARQAKQSDPNQFDLFVFDEIDSVVAEFSGQQVIKPITYAIKQASHQNVGIFIIGQSCAANLVGKMTWSDWNSVAQCHIGENARIVIENRFKNEPDKRELYTSQYNTIREYYERLNADNGLTLSDYGYYRFAYIIPPSGTPYFIEIPPFIFTEARETENQAEEQLNPDSLSINTQDSVYTTINYTPVVEDTKPVSKAIVCPKCGTSKVKPYGRQGRYECLNNQCDRKTFTPKS